jgi:hypothetical protein
MRKVLLQAWQPVACADASSCLPYQPESALSWRVLSLTNQWSDQFVSIVPLSESGWLGGPHPTDLTIVGASSDQGVNGVFELQKQSHNNYPVWCKATDTEVCFRVLDGKWYVASKVGGTGDKQGDWKIWMFQETACEGMDICSPLGFDSNWVLPGPQGWSPHPIYMFGQNAAPSAKDMVYVGVQLQAFNLPKADVHGKIDGYAVIACGSAYAETSIKYIDYHPMWPDQITLSLSPGKSCWLEIHDYDMGVPDEDIARVEIPTSVLLQLQAGESSEKLELGCLGKYKVRCAETISVRFTCLWKSTAEEIGAEQSALITSKLAVVNVVRLPLEGTVFAMLTTAQTVAKTLGLGTTNITVFDMEATSPVGRWPRIHDDNMRAHTLHYVTQRPRVIHGFTVDRIMKLTNQPKNKLSEVSLEFLETTPLWTSDWDKRITSQHCWNGSLTYKAAKSVLCNGAQFNDLKQQINYVLRDEALMAVMRLRGAEPKYTVYNLASNVSNRIIDSWVPGHGKRHHVYVDGVRAKTHHGEAVSQSVELNALPSETKMAQKKLSVLNIQSTTRIPLRALFPAV